VGPDVPRLSIPIAQWPMMDQELWSRGLREGGLFDVTGAAARWSAESRRKTASGYGRWLHWLESNAQCDHHAPPGQRVTPDRVAAYLRELSATLAPGSVLCRMQELSDALRVLAPDGERKWLAHARRAAAARARPVRDKRGRLRAVGELVALGERLMADAGQSPNRPPRSRAVQYRDGLMIALLAYRPVRQKNLASMRLGTNVVEQNGRHWMLFSGTETKSRVPYHAMFPDVLEDKLRLYLTVWRPILISGAPGGVEPGSDALWISGAGTRLTQGALADRIEKHTKAAFGQSIPPHWFRDAAATSIAIENPVHVRDAHLVLGHADLTTTEKYYNQATSLQASRRYQALLVALSTRTQSMSRSKGST
jgi:integrase/recombinase XerD